MMLGCFCLRSLREWETSTLYNSLLAYADNDKLGQLTSGRPTLGRTFLRP